MEVIETKGPVVFTGDVGGVRIGPGNPVVPPCPPPDIQIEDWLQSIQLLRELPAEQLFLTHYGLIEDKQAHLDALANILKDWAEWMKPHAAAGTPPVEIIPLFEQYVREQLLQAGVVPSALESYEKANPAFMSVAGLLRYWKKKGI